MKDDWIPQVPSTIINTKIATKRGKNVFGNRGITSIGSCTLTKVNSAQNRKIIDHILNQRPFREIIKEKYPLQISRLEQSVIDNSPPRKKRAVELCSSRSPKLTSNGFVIPMNSVGSFPLAPPTHEQLRFIEDIAGKLAVQLAIPEDGFELPIFRQFIHTISPHCPIPTTHRLRNVIIPRLYQTAKLEIEISVKSWQSAQISVDTWLDPSRRSVTYASLLRPFSDPKFATMTNSR